MAIGTAIIISEILSIEKKIDAVKTRRSRFQGNLNSINSSIAATSAELEQVKQQRSDVGKKVVDTTLEIKKITDNIDKMQRQLVMLSEAKAQLLELSGNLQNLKTSTTDTSNDITILGPDEPTNELQRERRQELLDLLLISSEILEELANTHKD